MLQPKEFLCTSVTLHILYASGYKKRPHASFRALLYVVERRDQVRTCIKDPCRLALTLDSGGLLRGTYGLGITLFRPIDIFVCVLTLIGLINVVLFCLEIW